MRRPRVRFRSPGVKPGQRIGPLGPFRGRLGVQWVVAPLALLLVLGAAAWLFLGEPRPEPPWRSVGTLTTVPPQRGREALPGVFLGRAADGRPLALAEEPGCALRVVATGFEDCAGRRYGFDGVAPGGDALDLVPLRVHADEVFIDPTRRIRR